MPLLKGYDNLSRVSSDGKSIRLVGNQFEDDPIFADILDSKSVGLQGRVGCIPSDPGKIEKEVKIISPEAHSDLPPAFRIRLEKGDSEGLLNDPQLMAIMCPIQKSESAECQKAHQVAQFFQKTQDPVARKNKLCDVIVDGVKDSLATENVPEAPIQEPTSEEMAASEAAGVFYDALIQSTGLTKGNDDEAILRCLLRKAESTCVDKPSEDQQ